MSKNKAMPVDDWERRVNFDFGAGKGRVKEPTGFKDLSVEDEVTVLVTGKVNSIRIDKESSSFSLVMDKVALENHSKKDDGLAGDFAAAKQERKV